MASLLVCFAHLRAFFLVDFDASGGGALAQAFYLVTGLHHQAVMVFFVLSGFFVGGALLRQVRRKDERPVDWLGFAVKRASRLWIVLIPALLLTLFWDRLGMHLAGPLPYAGQYLNILSSGPSQGEPASLSLATFLGNVFFLQTIATAAYGTNGPLWSLAYEGWYYLLFPLAILTVVGRLRIVAGALLGALLVMLWRAEPALLVLGINWLFGAALAPLVERTAFARVMQMLGVRLLTLLLFAATLVASRAGLWLGHDLLVGFTFTLVVAWLWSARLPVPALNRLAAGGADFSYTLYLVHFPFQAFLFFVFAQGTQMPFGLTSLAKLLLLFAACIIYALAVWWCFERNTGRVRDRILAAVRPAGSN